MEQIEDQETIDEIVRLHDQENLSFCAIGRIYGKDHKWVSRRYRQRCDSNNLESDCDTCRFLSYCQDAVKFGEHIACELMEEQ